MQSKLSACSIDIIRRKTLWASEFVDNCMFTSRPTLPPWQSATCSEHNCDPTTGINGLPTQDTSAQGTSYI